MSNVTFQLYISASIYKCKINNICFICVVYLGASTSCKCVKLYVIQLKLLVFNYINNDNNNQS